MKKSEIKKLVLLGFSAGFLISNQAHAAAEKEKSGIDYSAADKDYHLMTEKELLSELNDEGKAIYNSLDAKEKELAIEVASQKCASLNSCKGLNACKTDKNSCAGQAGCKGQSKCAFLDKNLAVKVARDKLMKEKRLDAIKK
ncbi:MAG TPA: hypothetical protein PLC42_05265 [Parachlamydiaceae bacterium]|nr:hypothetical protein [Parachlamydiaceae bacterium]